MIRDSDGTITSFDRGDVVWGIDPFKREESTAPDTSPSAPPAGVTPRPWLVLSTDSVPFHPAQYRCATLTSRTWHDDAMPIDTADWDTGRAPTSVSVLPWSVATIKHEFFDTTGELVGRRSTSSIADARDGFQGHLSAAVVDTVVNRLIGYLSQTFTS